MGARQRLRLLAATSGAVLILLGRTAHGAAEQLVQVPPQAWGLSDLSDAVVAGTCTCGALGALWHVVSALLALMALPRANGPSKRCRSGARALAVRVLEAWGAPAVRRIVASALLVSLSSAPALASEEASGGDDLGWRPTSSAPASPPSQSSTPSTPAVATLVSPSDRSPLSCWTEPWGSVASTVSVVTFWVLGVTDTRLRPPSAPRPSVPFAAASTPEVREGSPARTAAYQGRHTGAQRDGAHAALPMLPVFPMGRLLRDRRLRLLRQGVGVGTGEGSHGETSFQLTASATVVEASQRRQ